jgi:hypothetical protein
MAEFNPDEYLKEKEKEEFDPDAYLAGDEEDPSILKDLAREGVKALPMAGSVAGGILAGGPTLGAAALGGSALGAMAGKAAQNLIETYAFDEPVKPVEEQVKELGQEAVYDVAGNVTGEKIIAPVAGLAMKGVGIAYNKLAGGISKIPEPVMETMQTRYRNVENIPDVAEQADFILLAREEARIAA